MLTEGRIGLNLRLNFLNQRKSIFNHKQNGIRESGFILSYHYRGLCYTLLVGQSVYKSEGQFQYVKQMYSEGSEECFFNAEGLVKNAEALIKARSFGSAQSLCVIAIEEISKAIILELANLRHVSENFVDIAMRDHRPKKIVLLGIEQSRLLLGNNLTKEADQYIIDENKLKQLAREMQAEILDLEKKRQGGFYVQVDPKDGGITSSPRSISKEDASLLAKKAEIYLRVGKVLCGLFRNIKNGRKTEVTLRNVILPEPSISDHTITIVWDEI
jgi:AbiV family abortive infection protein